jgi:hypothetical protein
MKNENEYKACHSKNPGTSDFGEASAPADLRSQKNASCENSRNAKTL